MGEHSKDLPITIDYEAEAMYITLNNEKTCYTEEIIPCELNFDYNKNHEIIGIEILRKPIIKDITTYPDDMFQEYMEEQSIPKYSTLSTDDIIVTIYPNKHLSHREQKSFEKEIYENLKQYYINHGRSDYINKIRIVTKQI